MAAHEFYSKRRQIQSLEAAFVDCRPEAGTYTPRKSWEKS